MQNEHDKKKEVKENSCNIFPDINEVVKERNSNLDLIERKKEVNFSYKKLKFFFINDSVFSD